MGVLDRFEKGVERALSNTFARAFKADLKPVDIASALRTHMDDQTVSLSRGRTAVPNVFIVEVGPGDAGKIEQWGRAALMRDLVQAATNHATDQGYVFVGPVTIDVETIDDFKPGQFAIRSLSEHISSAAPAPAPTRPEPARAPLQPAAFHAQPILDVDGQRYLLTGSTTVLGRGSGSDIILSDSGVSRHHLEIRITPDGVIATDMGSTNGTFVEGHRISSVTLVDGNTMTIGRTHITFWAGSASSQSFAGGAV